jgi:hypothetical protein
MGRARAGFRFTQYTEARMPSEQKWYALTRRIVDAKVEADGDIHIALGMPRETTLELLAPTGFY